MASFDTFFREPLYPLISMSKGRLALVILIFTAVFVYGEQTVILNEKEHSLTQSEVESLDLLIAENEKHLATQKKLQALMKDFQRQQDEFLNGNQTKRQGFLMVTTARQILGMVKEEHLSHLFSSEYLEELVVFSSIAGKSAPMRP